MPTIAVVTVTYNAAPTLSDLLESLRAQTDRRFDWMVVDGASVDETTDILKAAPDIVSEWISEADCGIYSALNKAVTALTSDYYLVCGADDILASDAIENYRKYLTANPGCDIVVAGVRVGKQVISGYKPARRWLGHTAMFTQHSVGTLIRRELHQVHGLYNSYFGLLADGYFLKKAAIDPNTKVISADFLAGNLNPNGLSSIFLARTLSELWAIQLLTEPRPLLQTLIHFARVIKHHRRIVKNRCQFAPEKVRPQGN